MHHRSHLLPRAAASCDPATTTDAPPAIRLGQRRFDAAVGRLHLARQLRGAVDVPAWGRGGAAH
jgi:hypothetical protein